MPHYFQILKFNPESYDQLVFLFNTWLLEGNAHFRFSVSLKESTKLSMPGWGGKLGLAEDTLKDSGNKSIQNASKFLKDTMRSFGFKPVCNTSKSVELAL